MKKLLIGILVVLMLSIATVSANPVLNLIGNKMVSEGDTLEFNITCSAPDSGSTSFTDNASIGSLTKYNETKATFSWSPDYDDSGSYSVEFEASDSNSSDKETITITVVNTNREPEWTSSIPSQTVTEDSDLYVVAQDVSSLVNDPDGDTLTFSIGNENTNEVDCMIDADGTDLKIKPAADFSGTADCSVRARDATLSKDSSFSIVVTNTPDAPTITSNAVKSADINQEYSYDVQANDPDQDTLVYSLITSPDGMTINSNTGVISWTPNSTGDYNVKLEVTDGSTPDEQSFVLTVDHPMKLEIDDIDVWVDGKSDDSGNENGGTIDKDVNPESEIKMKIKLKNRYTSSEDIKIEDIEINAVIENMDEDEDDLEIDEEGDDIKPGKSESITLLFDVPLKIDEGDYDMTLTITANDENRDYDLQLDFVIKVDKEKHDIRVSELQLTPENLICSRHANLFVEVMNIGSNDEDSSDSIKLEVTSEPLGIDFTKKGIELDSDYDADDNTFEKAITIDLEDNFAPGSYYIKANVYRGSSIMDSKEVELIVEQCSLTNPTTPSSGDSGGDEGDGDVIVNVGDDSSDNLPPGFEGYLVADSSEETSFTNSGLYLVILVLAIVIVVGAGILLVFKFLLKPKSGFGDQQFNY